MKYSISYEPIDNIIISSVQGDVKLGMMSKMIDEIMAHVMDKSCHCLINDMRDARLNMTLLEITTLPGMFQSAAFSRGVDIKQLQRVLVAERKPEMIEMQSVFTRYLGGQFNHFQTIEEAKKWLMETRSHSQNHPPRILH